MDLKQIFIVALCLVPAWGCLNRCCDEDELRETAQKKPWSRIQPPQDLPVALHGPPESCPLDLYQRLREDIKDRSLSPWRYVRVTNQDYFPSTYVEAQCLCQGCIMMKKGSLMENHDYNSKPVLQSRAFLKREQSSCQGGQYRLKVEFRKVAVGCTCVTASSISS
ncbi:interleukin-17C [Kryptolebias marmoratus]|uniref:interleukin-17C n=1 Tax=Kryptolebias marmoratus TaxID=37003 RepID=UPI0007F921B5|nr:interleukin-17C [Kryptolebias marmoratus]